MNRRTCIGCTSGRVPILGGRCYANKQLRDLREPRPSKLLRASTCNAAKGQVSSSSSLKSIISAVADGQISAEDATHTIEIMCNSNTLWEPHNRVEVVEADGMATSQLAAVLACLAGKQYSAAARSVPSEVYATIRSMLPGVQYHGGARMLLYTDPNSDLPKVEKLPGHVAIVCGSSGDLQMAYEAKVALQLQGGYSTMLTDMSPTKLSQLLSRKEQLQAADAVIVCCGEQPALAGLILGLVDVPVVAIPGRGAVPDPNLAVAIQGACATAPGDGVSAANAAARTLHVAKQYIQHRKSREQETLEKCMDVQPMPAEEFLDCKPVAMPPPSSDSSLGSALIGAHADTAHTNGEAVNGKHANGTVLKGMR